MDSSSETVYRLLRALQLRNAEAVAAQLHPNVEAHGGRGTKRGIEEVVAWAKPSTEGHLVSSVEVDDLRQIGQEWVAVGARRLWSWKETGEPADEQPFGVLFQVQDGRVIDWNQTYGSVADAIKGIPAS